MRIRDLGRAGKRVSTPGQALSHSMLNLIVIVVRVQVVVVVVVIPLVVVPFVVLAPVLVVFVAAYSHHG